MLKKIIPGIKNELKETLNLFLMKGTKKEKLEQIFDLFKIFILILLFSVPFIGTVLVLFTVKKIESIKPSSFK